MNDYETADDGRLTTEQIAAAGDTFTDPQPSATDDTGANREPSTPLLEGDELHGVIERWREIQAQFVDEPRTVVREADALVADLMQRLARMFAGEREQLESRLASGDSASTEDLRQGLQRYRSFFERLLVA
ncbi:MAG TPA: hypothetical protein VGJ38_09420 [Jatrophihabitantaceae bacterium]|jgi:hypothetical protein